MPQPNRLGKNNKWGLMVPGATQTPSGLFIEKDSKVWADRGRRDSEDGFAAATGLWLRR
jgi:hypothetical protein